MCFGLSELLESSNKHSQVPSGKKMVLKERYREREREVGFLAERNLGKRGMWGI
jgi:hypothetical protein